MPLKSVCSKRVAPTLKLCKHLNLNNFLKYWTAAVLAAVAGVPGAFAQLAPGEYVMAAGYGVLRVSPIKAGAQSFDLNVRGVNFHTCELSGQVRNGVARMEESSDDKRPCVVTFTASRVGGVEVGSQHAGACRTYCGARAHFEGSYVLAPPACAPSAVRRARDRFKALYDKKSYAEARALLVPVVEKCGDLISEFDDAWVRNDLAITHYRMGELRACRDTLSRWVELARQPDREIKDGYPPSDADEMLRIANATRYNMKLCGAPIAVGGKP